MATTKIVFLVLPRVHLIDLGAAQVFHEAIDYGADVSLDYCTFIDDTTTSTQLPLGKVKSYRELSLQAGDYLFIPGTDGAPQASEIMKFETDFIDWVRSAYNNGAYVCSICTGAFVLASTGLLNGRKCTTHWKRTAELKQRFPSIHLMEDILFTEDERIFTSAGVTAGIDLALHILSKLTNEYVSYKVARELVVYLRRKGEESQQSIFMKYRSHIHSGIHKAQDYLQENMQSKVSLVQLADRACMSARNLTRTFKKETGITINEYTLLLRKELLRRLERSPEISRKQMAKQCGLKSERQVIRLLNAL